MLKQSSLFVSLFFLFQLANSQVITTEPIFPTANDSVRIIFDASQGNAGLAGYTGDIWAHTGVITDKSTSGSDWKYVIAGWSQNIDKAKLKSLGNNRWELKIGPSIRTFYGVPANEKILKIALVFRNSNGSKEGKTKENSDIFATVYEAGLNITLITPDKDFLAVDPGTNIQVQAGATSTDSMALFHDSVRLFSNAGTTLSYVLTSASSGYHEVQVVGYGQGLSVTDAFSYLVKGGGQTADLPVGVKDGINYSGESQATLVLYAPGKEFVFAIGGFNNWMVDPAYQMKKTPDGNRYWITLTNLEPQKEYLFQYLVDGEIRIADPYADKISDPWNDQYINEVTYPGLIHYPAGKTTQAASVLQPGQHPYQWKHNTFTQPDKKNIVLYELLIRDFLTEHTFNALIDTLGYLKKLGINAIELMPVSEFEGNDSWGYNPSFYFAVDKYYGPKNTFRALVDSAHQMGMAVVMDMVLNHSYGQSPLVRLYWDAANNRPSATNPWYNVQSPNSSYSWGYDFNHQSVATQRFVDSVTSYWLTEYRVDGFRFDFTKGFTNTPGDGGGYDASRIAILKRMASKIWVVNPSAYVILEHFAANSEEKELTDFGMMVWGNSNYNYRQAVAGWFSGGGWDFSGISWRNRGWSQPGLVGYMESHDEERLMYECVTYGNTQNQTYPIRQLENSLKRMELAANFFIPIPGPKMIWMFGELGYDYSINFNGRIGQKPIRWDYYTDSRRKRLYQIYSALNDLKSSYPAMQSTDFQLSFSDSVKRIQINHPDMNSTILGNFGVRNSSRDPQFQHTGWWYEYWNGDSLLVTSNPVPITLRPGEYRFYTDKRLSKPDIISGLELVMNPNPAGELSVYPNPAGDRLTVSFNDGAPLQGQLKIRDVSGRELAIHSIGIVPGCYSINQDISNLPSGIYFIEITIAGARSVRKFVKE